MIVEARNEPRPTSKEAALTLRDGLRAEIRNGTFVDPAASVAPPPPPADDVRLTVGDVMDLYVDGHVRVPGRKQAGQVVTTCLLKRLRATRLPAANGTTITLGEKPLDDVTAADLDVLRRDWTLKTTAAQGGRTGPNRALKRLRHFWNWSIEKGHTERTPFKRGHVNTIHFGKEAGRTRRLEGDEERRLLAHATTPLMKVLISAGLETGCRIGELLQLTWRDVSLDRNALLISRGRAATSRPVGRA